MFKKLLDKIMGRKPAKSNLAPVAESLNTNLTKTSDSVPPPSTGGRQPRGEAEQNPTIGDTFQARILRDIVYFVLIIMFVGVGAMFLATAAMFYQSFNNQAASYQSLTQEINQQNAEIQLLIQEVKK